LQTVLSEVHRSSEGDRVSSRAAGGAVKPQITVDDRGVLLHVSDSQGETISVPMDPERIADGVKIAFHAAKSEKGKRLILRALGKLVRDLLDEP
jgi:hypothetical protein